MDWQASSMPPPQPPALLNAHPIFPSTFIQCDSMVSSQNRFIFQDTRPMLVGLPTAIPSHQSTSSADAASTCRIRTSVSGTCLAPSATKDAICDTFPERESNSTRILFEEAI